jgi:hypothetical protein
MSASIYIFIKAVWTSERISFSKNFSSVFNTSLTSEYFEWINSAYLLGSFLNSAMYFEFITSSNPRIASLASLCFYSTLKSLPILFESYKCCKVCNRKALGGYLTWFACNCCEVWKRSLKSKIISLGSMSDVLNHSTTFAYSKELDNKIHPAFKLNILSRYM